MSASKATTNAPTLTIAATDGRTVYISNGAQFNLNKRTDGPWLAPLLAEGCARHGIAQLWLVGAEPPALELGEGDAYDWDFREAGHNRYGPCPESWIHTFKRHSNLTVELVRPGLDPQSPWHVLTDPQQLLYGLKLYADLVGVPYHRSPAGTSAALLTRLHEGGRNAVALARVPSFPPPALDVNTEQPVGWMLPVDPGAPMAAYIHAYDKNACFLGAASNLPLGAGRPDHVTSPHGNEKLLPGYFRVQAPREDMHDVPSFMPARKPDADGTRWVTTPTLSYLIERHGAGNVGMLDAYVWREHHQPLQPWYKRLRDARAHLLHSADPAARAALAAVKLSYSSLLNGYVVSSKLDEAGKALYRPDIRHMVIARARSNLVRTARALRDSGVMVLAIAGIDTLYVASSITDPVEAVSMSPLILGAELSQYKVKASVAVTPALWDVLTDRGLSVAGRIAAITTPGATPAPARVKKGQVSA